MAGIGMGQFVDDTGLFSGTANQAIIAAGSHPTKIPSFPYDDPRLMDSTDALELKQIPKKLLVVGGGNAALCAALMAAAGEVPAGMETVSAVALGPTARVTVESVSCDGPGVRRVRLPKPTGGRSLVAPENI